MPVTPPQLRRPRALWRSGFPLGYQKLSPDPIFPINGLLDDFNRADEGPPPSANWSNLTPLTATGTVSVIGTVANVSGNGSIYWNPTTFGPDCEAYCKISSVGEQYLHARIQSPGSASWDGYTVMWKSATNAMAIFRVDNDTFTQLVFSANHPQAIGDRFGIQVIGNGIFAWKQKAGQGPVFVASARDSTYSSAGYIGKQSVDGSDWDDFGGGSIPVSTAVTDTTTIGGAVAAGVEPTVQVPVPQGGATAGGTAPTPSVPVPQGGATAGGNAPTAQTSVTLSGATAGGFGPTARVTLTIAGAVAGGFAPSETFGDTPTPGGAIAGGLAPTARVPTAISGAAAAGLAATVRVTTPVGGAVAQGFAPFSAQTVVIGGATAGGFGPTARVTMTIGGATAGGYAPNDGSAPSGPGPYDANYFLLIHP